MERVQADLTKRAEKAGAPMPAVSVIAVCALSLVVGVLSIYGAI